MTSASARYPGRAPIDAYGNGGFRFAEMSHRGSILCLPSGIYAWPPTHPREIEPAAFAPAFAERDVLGLLLLGTGRRQEMPSGEVRRAFGVDVIDGSDIVAAILEAAGHVGAHATDSDKGDGFVHGIKLYRHVGCVRRRRRGCVEVPRRRW